MKKLRWRKISNFLKVAKYTLSEDVRVFSMKGYKISSEFLDIDPITGKQLRNSEYFVFAEKL